MSGVRAIAAIGPTRASTTANAAARATDPPPLTTRVTRTTTSQAIDAPSNATAADTPGAPRIDASGSSGPST
ncbi:Uncharacterised protein [Mycobacteroides abscessus subsp. abscessus]|nr:Uncharacterised protein [Mycobacteroides abscessus subsp. abscessus]